MTTQSGQSTPAPETQSAPQIVEYVARGKSVEEFSVSAAEQFLRMGVLITTTSKSKENPTTYASYAIGTGPTDFRKKLTLTMEQSKRLNTAHGAPLDLAMSIALLDLTPVAKLQGRSAERRAATVVREAKNAGSLSDNALLQELERRGIKIG